MTLNLKNYKGFEKKPYCNAHCPQAKATTVADTPESRRLAENTRIQSQAKYHEDFEKSKGKNFTTIADDPETVRIKNTSKIISNVSYHGELERKKQMEEKRGLSGAEEAADTIATVNAINNNNSSHHQNRMHQNNTHSPYHQHQNHSQHQRQQEPPSSNYPSQQQQHPVNNNHQQLKLQKQLLEQQQSQLAHQQQALKYNLLKQQQQHQQVLYSHDHVPGGQPVINRHPDARQSHLPPQFSNKYVHMQQQQYPQPNGVHHQQQQQMISRQHQAMMQQQQRHPQMDMNRHSTGQIPVMNPLIVPNPQQQMIKIPLQHQQSPKYGGQPINELGGHQPSPTHLVGGAQMTNSAPNMIGNPKVVSYSVNGPQQSQQMINHAYNQRPPPMRAMVNGVLPKQQQQYALPPHVIRHVIQPGQPQPPSQHHPLQQQMMQRNQHMQQQQQIHYQQQQQFPITARVYRAMYDYEANDIDEVTFFENDVLINCVDAGGNWLIGKVARTGQEGMFPANYVTEYSNHA